MDSCCAPAAEAQKRCDISDKSDKSPGHGSGEQRDASDQSISAALEAQAANAEYDSVIPQAWAEGLARLSTKPAPADVPVERWQTFIEDCAHFADRWAAQAAALGWTPLDLWGCHPVKPFARVDMAGLCWLLNGREIAAITTDTATIRAASGNLLTYRRRAVQGREPAILAWGIEGVPICL